ncbi:glycosyltransferase family A protein [uncultured Jannaschia sp.]|uniref:glycosyltransferase family 2 protein n=1 Tax=uncultured Jannaschia sp. TaxID=293347 RepID=UPI0026042001|nr:glycosyltransferase family A protein [uncultured Jannaschia sp.]
MATIGPAAPLTRLLDSLSRQTALPLEVIVVDQNDRDAPVAEAIGGAWPFPVVHLHTPGMRGASRGRNVGLRRASGAVVGFPDDDCWYPADCLARALALLADPDMGFVAGRPVDETGRTINGRFENAPQRIVRANVWTTSIEWLQFFRRDLLKSLDGYDETIGVGATTPWQSAEAQDLVLRALATGATGFYDPDMTGHHEELPVARSDPALRRKLRRYGRGMGHVLRRHGYGLVQFLRWSLRPLGGALIFLARRDVSRAKLHAAVAFGRLEGYVGRTIGE